MRLLTGAGFFLVLTLGSVWSAIEEKSTRGKLRASPSATLQGREDMRGIEAIHLDEASWTTFSRSADALVWRNERGEQLSLTYFPKRPDIDASLGDVGQVRDFYRRLAVSPESGLVSADVVQVAGVRAAKVIIKAKQQPSGMIYLGSLTLPFQTFSYVIKVQCNELGMTGLRDTVMFSKLMAAAGETKGDPTEGWMRDPYDPSRRDPLMRNQSEDERYDAKFPDHPLSRVRQHLARIAGSVRLDERVAKSPPFEP